MLANALIVFFCYIVVLMIVTLVVTETTGYPHKQCVSLCSKFKEMYGRILKSLNIVNLYRGMLKLKINVKVPQLLCIVVSVDVKTTIHNN